MTHCAKCKCLGRRFLAVGRLAFLLGKIWGSLWLYGRWMEPNFEWICFKFQFWGVVGFPLSLCAPNFFKICFKFHLDNWVRCPRLPFLPVALQISFNFIKFPPTFNSKSNKKFPTENLTSIKPFKRNRTNKKEISQHIRHLLA